LKLSSELPRFLERRCAEISDHRHRRLLRARRERPRDRRAAEQMRGASLDHLVDLRKQRRRDR